MKHKVDSYITSSLICFFKNTFFKMSSTATHRWHFKALKVFISAALVITILGTPRTSALTANGPGVQEVELVESERCS